MPRQPTPQFSFDHAGDDDEDQDQDQDEDDHDDDHDDIGSFQYIFNSPNSSCVVTDARTHHFLCQIT